ncbi:hypothetical protein HU200_048147 [Digitaria exilis]|uniref:Protein FAR1-RELATED SEQUENCE n=1 Tax=Digitaria exilis TaxID=1010633 RepID=A0A835AXZ5_9POAL|nr:hypothetical protein HU200_048147 [Digitaria exilis]
MTVQDIVCSCEGHARNPNSASIRTGCRAKIRLLRRSDHSWYIARVEDTHNHALTEDCGETKQWGSHGELDPMTKHLITKLKENNVSLGKICNILELTDTTVRKQSVRSMCASMSQQSMRDDIGKTIRLLTDMKRQDPGLEVRFQMDSNGTLESMLWCTGKNRFDYSLFGDAITFDTTYRTNLYNLPFGLFVGIKNHFQSIIFGDVLLTTEKTADFEWAFETFLDIMGGGGAPKTILTDQCAAMAKALKTTMPKTRHRWCRWHVLKDAKSYLGILYSKHSKFKKEFNSLVTFQTDTISFERRWKQLVKTYQLGKNTYLQRLYKYRERWAKPYFMGVFCGG